MISEIAEVLVEAGTRYAAIDLDWLCWGWPSDDDEGIESLMLMNPGPMLANYTTLGVTRFRMADSRSPASETPTNAVA